MNKYEFYREEMGLLIPTRPVTGAKALTPGVYTIGMSMDIGLYFNQLTPKTDELIDIPNSISDELVKDIENFMRPEVQESFKKYGMVHKRGILMHGPGGTGKTSTIAKITEKIIALGGIVLFGPNPGIVSQAVKAIKEIQPGVPVVLVYEELETWLSRASHEMLSLLDGELQNDGVVVLATTNYISRIPARVKSRPSRFAITKEVGVPSPEFREEFFKRKLHASDLGLLPSFVEASDGFVVDQMKDMIVSVCCLGQDLSDVVRKIKEMKADSIGVDDYQEEYTSEVFLEKKPKKSPLKGI